MSAGLGFVLAVMALAVVAIAIGLRACGLSWRESLSIVAQAVAGVVFVWALVVLFAALGAAPVR